jgi:hypothetical protein
MSLFTQKLGDEILNTRNPNQSEHVLNRM